jgi:prepilin-type N-terminal cleavage/methylation domain-containing protein/prepilin-type processing-associated H-X9-DG protein
MAQRYRAAFTLVELLVVIAIIATLVGLLLPAVLSARVRAQIAQCAHNQQQVGQAMISYELAKGHLPGYANNLRMTMDPVTKQPRVASWAPFMLPYVGRVDLWEGGWRDGDTAPNVRPASYVQLFVCPSDSPTGDCPLSWVVNVGQGQPQQPVDALSNKDAYTTQHGLFRNLTLTTAVGQNGNVKQISMTDVKSASLRPMIAESAYNLPNVKGVPVPTNRQWTDIGVTNVTAQKFGFLFAKLSALPPILPNPVVGTRNPSTGVMRGALVPIHAGVINVTFCDGHTDGIANDPENVCGNYDCTDIP